MEVSEKAVSNHRDFLMIGLLVALILTFLMWANFTRLDLVTRGSGRVIAIGENKNVQTSERGIIKEYLIKKGQSVAKNQVIAKINPIEAEGVLEELNSRLTTLNAKLTRIDGELNLISLESMKAKLSIFPEEVMRAELDLFEARRLEYQAIIEGITKGKSKIEGLSTTISVPSFTIPKSTGLSCPCPLLCIDDVNNTSLRSKAITCKTDSGNNILLLCFTRCVSSLDCDEHA